MLGLQNTRTGVNLPTRTYRCVACAATFPGLSSLLVHQASHANDGDPLDKLQPPPYSPGISCTHCSTVFASKEFMNQHQCGALPTSSSSVICESGENFQHQDALMDHKKLDNQGSDLQAKDCSVEEENSCKTKGTLSSPLEPTSPFSSQESNLVSGSDLGSSDLQLIPLLTGSAIAPESESEKEDLSTSPQSNFNKAPLVPGQLTTASVSQPVVFSAMPAFTPPQNRPSLFENKVMGPFLPSNTFSSSRILPLTHPLGPPQPKKTLKKMLFSEFMKRLPPAQISCSQTMGNTFTKKAVSSAVGIKPSTASSSGTSVRQLRKLLRESAAKRKSSSQASAILNLISSSKRHLETASYIVNLNRTFLPVVALVTRQKLLGSGKDGVGGRHQCGRCRKIFQDVDSLILHHAIHRKERIHGCHHCSRLLIGKLAFPEKHLCSKSSMLPSQEIFSVGILLSSSTGTLTNSGEQSFVEEYPLPQTTLHLSAKKNYHCFLCNQSYTRLYSLKKHKCLGMTSILKAAAAHKKDGEQNTVEQSQVSKQSCANEKAGDELSQLHKSIGVGTAAPQGIKVEAFDVGSVKGVVSSHCLQTDGPHLGVGPEFPKTLTPFLNSVKAIPSKTVASQMGGRCDFPALNRAPILQGKLKKNKRERKTVSGSTPRDKRKGTWTMPMDELEIDQLIEAEGANDDDNELEEEGVMESIVATQNRISSHNLPVQNGKCFSCSHCGSSYTRRFTLNQHQKKCHPGVKLPVQQNIRKALKVGKAWGKQSFDCLQCGRSFCYRDTLVLHQKNCQPRNGRGDGARGHTDPKKTNSMPLGQGSMFVLPPSSQAKGGKGPENKTQTIGGDWGIMSLPSVLPRKVTCECGEAFTCPRLLFEHLQLHAQESYICPECGESLPSWTVFEAHLRKHKQTQNCQNCNQTFRHRSSLRRHVRENRCKGNTIA